MLSSPGRSWPSLPFVSFCLAALVSSCLWSLSSPSSSLHLLGLDSSLAASTPQTTPWLFTSSVLTGDVTRPSAHSWEPGPRPTSRASTPSWPLASCSVSSSPGSVALSPGTLVVQPFFPTDVNSDDVCNHASVSMNTTIADLAGVEVPNPDELDIIPYLAWPFILISVGHLLPVLGFILISKSPQNFVISLF